MGNNRNSGSLSRNNQIRVCVLLLPCNCYLGIEICFVIVSHLRHVSLEFGPAEELITASKILNLSIIN